MIELPVSQSGRSAIEVAHQAARQAGKILKANFHKGKQVKSKGRGNLVTDVDLAVEEALRSFLRSEYPDHGIISEESPAIHGSSEYTWVLDPLDGTNNYSFGIPFFCTVLALTRGNDVLLGVIYAPLMDELFWACEGGGAFLNSSPIHVSRKTRIAESLLGLDLGYVDQNGKRTLEFLAGLWPNVFSLRIMGSGALGMAYVACGRIDLYFHLLLYPWELACGSRLVAEAGGAITDREGRPTVVGESSVVASNPALHAEFLKLVHPGK